MTQAAMESIPLLKAPSHSPPDQRFEPARNVARGLGWFSIALGAVEVLAPHSLGRAIGVHRPGLLQAFGLREIATGVGLLSQPRSAGWMWGRVFGDVLDMAVLAEAATPGDSTCQDRSRALGALAAVSGVTLVDAIVAVRESTHSPTER